MGTFRRRRVEQVADFGFLTCDDIEVEAPDGVTFHRVVVRHGGAVVVVPVEADGARVWCVRQYRSAVDRHILELPAGKRDVAGEPPEATAARELEEELGFRAGRFEKVAEFLNSPGFTDERTHVYVAFDLDHTGAAAPASPEERDMEPVVVRFDEVDAMIASGQLDDGKTIIGLLLARRHLGRVP
jgi:ADP-ribose pyrophosphatase